MAKKKSSKVAEVSEDSRAGRPKISPYTSPSVPVSFGPKSTYYYVPKVLLDKLENVPASDPWGRASTHFANVDAGTGHVLVHFLHAGTYQTLDDETEDVSFTSINTNNREFEKATLVIEAATTHGLLGLQRLAKQEMERVGSNMSLCDIVAIIREDLFGKPPYDPTWIRDYISGKVWSAFEHDSTVFSRPGFFENIKSPTLTKLLAESVVGLYSEQVKRLREEKVEAVKRGHQADSLSGSPNTNEQDVKMSDPAAWPTTTAQLGAFNDSDAAWEPHVAGDKTDANANAVGKAQSETQHLELNSIDEQRPSAESLAKLKKKAIDGIKESKKKKKNKAIPVDVLSPSTATQSTNEQFSVVLESAVGAGEQPESLPKKKKKKSVAAVADSLRLHDDTTESLPEAAPETLPKKKKKKAAAADVSPAQDHETGLTAPEPVLESPAITKTLEKKPDEAAGESGEVELLPELEPDLAMKLVDPFYGLSKSQRKKLEKQMKEEAAKREREAEVVDGVVHQPELENLPVDPFAELNKEQRKQLKNRVEEDAVLREREAEVANDVGHPEELVQEAPLEPELPPVDPFAGLSKSQKKKLEKRLKEEAAAKEREPDLAIPTVHDPETGTIPEATHDMTQHDQPTTATVEPAETTNIATSLEQQEKSTQQDAFQPIPSPPQPTQSEQTPNPIPPPTAPASARETGESWSDWGSPSIWPKKKKKKTKKVVSEEESAVSGSDLIEPPLSSNDVVEPAPTTSQDADEGDAWGDGWGDGVLSKKKKKKGKGKKAALKEEEVVILQQEAESAETVSGAHVIEEEESAVPSADPEFCPFRTTHLAVENGGITCAPCQAYIWRVVGQSKEGGGGVAATE
ncbi:hypothetical protein N0V94_008035 [Neodidymelliopsis sp. IMI 364377]|nr:hypothetical protein N0V94_008035 [Neodidymelliopsis sp. IMI 364377]